ATTVHTPPVHPEGTARGRHGGRLVRVERQTESGCEVVRRPERQNADRGTAATQPPHPVHYLVHGPVATRRKDQIRTGPRRGTRERRPITRLEGEAHAHTMAVATEPVHDPPQRRQTLVVTAGANDDRNPRTQGLASRPISRDIARTCSANPRPRPAARERRCLTPVGPVR